MGGEYRKYTVEMKRVTDAYRLWKRGTDDCACVVESYKNKRSVYFAVSNLLSSCGLLTDANKEYHLVLMGADDGQLIHRDFGAFFVNQRGDGTFFKKFDGPPLESYTHCLFLAVNNETGKTDTIFTGSMPFFQEEKKFDILWKAFFGQCTAANALEVFSADRDETGAQWHRISDIKALPAPLESKSGALIGKYGHYILGERDGEFFAGVPGRFLKAEKPEGFALWQPMRGGEKFFDDLSELTGRLQEEIFGYWISVVDSESGEIGMV